MRPEHTGSLVEGVFSGTVVHTRNFDIAHNFDYPIWMSLTPMHGASLPPSLQPRWSKYLNRQRVESLVNVHLHEDTHQIWLLTQPSLVGRSFNPVSFYFVTENSELRWIVAHITNTPWDEEHCYVLRHDVDDVWEFDKAFHVSPFMPMDLSYRWRFHVSAERININMRLLKDGQRIFSAVLDLTPQPINGWQAVLLRLRYPLQNARNLVRIYYQAALLKLKGAHFHAHPNSTPNH